ncbi:hypothetical protein NEHOM01_0982 [Nematocida homosporus]|uniref:uncharacterized protein n=1 Tax=Nematocida homosporus TaxID=1912981 RepID=UPI00221E6E57|nr:uncharacterized protein NEHOM01_0982 [Nematocida homosporus]KAI5185656.1 hypothetical protein NEHOM01_0982 [Nematocida homosporus]
MEERHLDWSVFSVFQALFAIGMQVLLWVTFAFYFQYNIIGVGIGSMLYLTLLGFVLAAEKSMTKPSIPHKQVLLFINTTSLIVGGLSILGFILAAYNSAIRIEGVIYFGGLGAAIAVGAALSGLVFIKQHNPISRPSIAKALYYLVLILVVLASISLPMLRLFLSYNSFVMVIKTGIHLTLSISFGVLKILATYASINPKQQGLIFKFILAAIIISLLTSILLCLYNSPTIDQISTNVQSFFTTNSTHLKN